MRTCCSARTRTATRISTSGASASTALTARNLTPYRDVLAIVLGMHHEDPHLIAVGMNDRDARWHDLYIVDIRTGERRLVYENTDEIATLHPR